MQTSLEEYIERKGKLDECESATIIQQIANGVKHIHEAGYIHFDLKTKNLNKTLTFKFKCFYDG